MAHKRRSRRVAGAIRKLPSGRPARQEMGLLPIRAKGACLLRTRRPRNIGGTVLSLAHVNPIKLLVLVAIIKGVAAENNPENAFGETASPISAKTTTRVPPANARNASTPRSPTTRGPPRIHPRFIPDFAGPQPKSERGCRRQRRG
jgi:hypothetical protein